MTTTYRSDTPIGMEQLDADLVRSLRRASWMRQGFYVVVLIVAMAGQVTGAVEALHIPLVAAVPAVAALELGGIVVLNNADVRRRLGERAVASRLLSAAIAAWAVAFNWLAHANHLLGGFYAGMSALGYAVWLMHTENQRRDRLRAKGDLPPTTPAYELWAHWVRHPLLTMRAKSLAKANPRLGLYDSMAAARAEVKRERRTSAISKVLHRKIRSAVDPTTADIAVAVYDLDEIATRLADGADYDGLTYLIGADLVPARLTTEPKPAASEPETDPDVDLDNAPVGTADFELFTLNVEGQIAELSAAVTERDDTIAELRTTLTAVYEELQRLAPLAGEVVELRRTIGRLQSQRPELPHRREPVPRQTQRRDRPANPQAGTDELPADRERIVADVVNENHGRTGKELDGLIARRLKVSERTARRARESYQRSQQSTRSLQQDEPTGPAPQDGSDRQDDQIENPALLEFAGQQERHLAPV